MSDALAGVDLGGTNIKVALATMGGELLLDESVSTEGHAGPDRVLGRIVDLIRAMAKKSQFEIKAVGMGVPGLVDIDRGITKFLPNLPDQWRDVPVAARLSHDLKCPVRVANDARTATLGELRFGHGRQHPDVTLAFFTIGTGVGGGVAINGELRLGPLGAAGELGHQTILPDGPQCGCGNRGCLETLSSGVAIASEGVRLMRAGLAPRLHDIVSGNVDRVSVAEMMQAQTSDKTIHIALENAARYIGIAAANVVAVLHPQLVIFGGGVAEMGDLLLRTVKTEITNRVGMFPTEDVQVLKSNLGTQAGVIGAIALAMDEMLAER